MFHHDKIVVEMVSKKKKKLKGKIVTDEVIRNKSNTITSKYLRQAVHFDRLEVDFPIEGQSHSCNLLGELDLKVKDDWDLILDITDYQDQQKWKTRVTQGFTWKGHPTPYQDFLLDKPMFNTRDINPTRSIDVNWSHVNIDE